MSQGIEDGKEDEVVSWLKAQLELKSQRQLGRDIKIDPSVISRNMRALRKKKGLAGPFRKRIQNMLEQERAAELHRQHLREQAEAEELERQEAIARERAAKLEAEREEEARAAKEKADREAEKAAAKMEAERERQQREFEKALFSSFEEWEAKFRAAGYMKEGQEVEGDADELFFAGISELDYVDVGTAAVALLPDDFVIWRDKTVAYFREGVSFRQRLQKRAVREGQSRPDMIGNFTALDVYYDPLPDRLWRYGRAGVKLIAEWRELTDAYGHLATGKLPKIVCPETVKCFARLITIEEMDEYSFQDSRLAPDARDRLKQLQRRATLPAIGLTTAGMTWSACKSAANWLVDEGWYWLGLTLLAAMAAAVVFGIGWGLVQLWNWGWSVGTDAVNWVSDNRKEFGLGLLLAAELAVLGGMAFWWVRSGGSGWAIVGRIGILICAALVVTAALVMLFMVGKTLHEMGVALQPYRQRILIP